MIELRFRDFSNLLGLQKNSLEYYRLRIHLALTSSFCFEMTGRFSEGLGKAFEKGGRGNGCTVCGSLLLNRSSGA